MSLLRSTKSASIERTSVLVGLKVIHRKDHAINEQEIWQALVDAFRDHPTLDVLSAEVSPNKNG